MVVSGIDGARTNRLTELAMITSYPHECVVNSSKNFEKLAWIKLFISRTLFSHLTSCGASQLSSRRIPSCVSHMRNNSVWFAGLALQFTESIKPRKISVCRRNSWSPFPSSSVFFSCQFAPRSSPMHFFTHICLCS